MSSPIEPAPGRHGQGAGQRGPRISRRVAAIAESATLAIDARAKALKAMGEDVVAFGAGEPDFPTPAHVVEAAAAATHQPRFHHYTPTAGLPELREAVAAKTARDSGYQVQPGQVLVTNGGKQAIFNAFATLLDPGDEVLVPAPYWVTYPEAITLAGGVPVFVPTDASSGFRTDTEHLEAARTPRTKVLLFVSPSNPTGAVYPREAIEAIGAWAAEHGLWVLTDEIYEHLVYGGNRLHSLPALVPEQAERTVVVNGVAKTYAMTGWRVGWMLGPAGRGDADARGVRPPPPAHPRASGRDPRGDLHGAAGRVLRVPVRLRRARPEDPRTAARGGDGAGRPDPGGGAGGDRARRGLRRARLRPPVLRAGPRRPGGGHHPHRQAAAGSGLKSFSE